MTALYSKPEAFSTGECERIITTITAVSSKDAMLVGQAKDHSVRSAKLVWVDDVEGLGWVMGRLIEIFRRSNADQFYFDLHEFAESPQVTMPLTAAILLGIQTLAMAPWHANAS